MRSATYSPRREIARITVVQFGGISLETLNAIWESLILWWFASYACFGFAPVVQIAFGVNVAYAALVRVGNYQGKYLTNRADITHEEANRALDLLKAEGDHFQNVQIESDRTRALNIVSEVQERIQGEIVFYAVGAIFAAIASLIILYVCGVMPNEEIRAPLILLMVVVLFFPVPLGLVRTYFLVCACEKEVRLVYNGFLAAVEHISAEPAAGAKEALERVKKQLGTKPNGMWKRFLVHEERGPEE